MTQPPESQQQYGSILTIFGENAEQNGKLLNKQLEITHMAIGDANDQYVQPDRKQNALVNELARIKVNSVDVLQPTPDSVPMLKVDAILPDDVNDLVIREFAVVATFNGQEYFHAVGNCARVYVPPPINNGNVNTPVTLEMIFVITSAEAIVEIDPNVVTASREYVQKLAGKPWANGGVIKNDKDIVIFENRRYYAPYAIESDKKTWATMGQTPIGDPKFSDRFLSPLTVHDFSGVLDGEHDDTESVIAATEHPCSVDALAKTANVSVDPETIDRKNVKNIVVKKGNVKDFSEGFFNETVSKITNGLMYTAWAQDSAYALNNQIRVWANQKDSHTDGTSTPVCFYSDDFGSTYSSFLLDETLNNHSVWSAGVAGGKEYIFVRDDHSAPEYTYLLYSREIPSGGTGKYFDGWSIHQLRNGIELPVPPVGGVGTTMIHSFCEGHDGSIVVGAHNGDGAWLLRSTDGRNFTATTLLAGGNEEEPTVKFSNGCYYGFLRAGSTGKNPRFWYSNGHDLADVSFFTAPAGTFGENGLSDCPVPFQITDDGTIHAFAAYRNGVLEGRADDSCASMFYIRANIHDGLNIWSKGEVFRLGVAHHAEFGGASAIGVGSVILHHNNVHIFGGSEGRTGQSYSRDRIADIYQWTFPQKRAWGAHDFRQHQVRNGVAPTQVHKLRGENQFGFRANFFLQQRERLSEAYKNLSKVGLGYCIDGYTSSIGYGLATDATYGFFYTYGKTNPHPRGFRVEANSTDSNVGILVNNEEKIRLYDGPNNRMRPTKDGLMESGSPSHRWKEVWCVNAANNTSDETLKDNIESLPVSFIEPLLSIADDVKMWQWIEAIAKKEKEGKQARIHFSPTAQRVYELLKQADEDPFKYGLVGKDKVTRDEVEIVEVSEGQFEEVSREVAVLDEHGKPKEIWNIRATEILFGICWALRQRQKENENRLINIESHLGLNLE
ncbi:phage tail-collar fiber domain-containing protein [Enterovibrio norvegicus]|uniref:phage tail-collar fiber domain-containing protein n=1 Tax=Enterovibrio norvegicus TaxID=188144 RepID=UPI003551613F